jgi:predicted RNA binding protein YcfA (HicA-like mRNA interferase family)
MLEEDGWYLDRTRGSHRQYKHSTKPSDELAPGTLNSILKQAGLRK